MRYWVTITFDTSFHDECTLRLHNRLRKSLSVLLELDMATKREKDNTEKQESCFTLEILTIISFLKTW